MYLGIDWQSYAIHDAASIQGFFGQFRWLSSFHLHPVLLDDMVFPSNEHAYQAAKRPKEDRSYCLVMTPFQAMRWGQECLLDVREWSDRREEVMYLLNLRKFQNPGLRARLVATRGKVLVELNHWGDNFWGVDYKTPEQGKNVLGQIIMSIRNLLDQ